MNQATQYYDIDVYCNVSFFDVDIDVVTFMFRYTKED